MGVLTDVVVQFAVPSQHRLASDRDFGHVLTLTAVPQGRVLVVLHPSPSFDVTSKNKSYRALSRDVYLALVVIATVLFSRRLPQKYRTLMAPHVACTVPRGVMMAICTISFRLSDVG
jgi:hypothetical protein